jgi:NDP-hexose C3-ketoreductase / dTDP-4-oxo-2-deoxy-alpha-D-pentos-2-ene 2,3-reductase
VLSDYQQRLRDRFLDAATLAQLDALFPPPGPNGSKPAPEAYAW